MRDTSRATHLPMETTTDILIIGAGPAGLHAAREALHSPSRPRVLIADENAHPGGQIWRRSAPPWAVELLSSKDPRLTYLPGTTIVQPCADGALLALRGGETSSPLKFHYARLILAVGARELFLPFPGWTLPGVMGAGGAQAMAKNGMDVAGKRIVVAGSGPLLLAVASYLKKRGAIIPAIVEQAPAGRVNRFAAGLLAHPGKLVQAIALKASLLGVPYWTSAWPVRAHGEASLTRVTIRRVQGTASSVDTDIPCDILACGFGLVPSAQLPAVLGCEIDSGRVVVDELQRTTRPTVFCAGEPTGIGGVETASLEGRIAGLAAAGDDAVARRLLPAKAAARRFAQRLNLAFALRDELKSLPAHDTICCRCEDVTLGQLRGFASWREAKLQARCGMGPCQGRVCGPIARYLLNMEPADARPPIVPVPLGVLAGQEP